MHFPKIKVLTLIIAFSLYPFSLRACNQQLIAPLETHIQFIINQLPTAYAFSEQAFDVENERFLDMIIRYEPNSEMKSINVSGNIIRFNKYFARMLVHSSLKDAFLRSEKVTNFISARPIVLGEFDRAISLNSSLDYETQIFPYFIGFTEAETPWKFGQISTYQS